MPSSAVPDALDALVAVLSAALPEVDVFDGPPMEGERPDWVAVGYSAAAETYTAVTDWTQTPAGLGAGAREERFSVLCSLGSSSGNPSMAERRDRAFAILAEVEAALRGDGTLTGAVRFAEFAAGELLQEQTKQGTTVGVDFRVAVQVRI